MAAYHRGVSNVDRRNGCEEKFVLQCLPGCGSVRLFHSLNDPCMQSPYVESLCEMSDKLHIVRCKRQDSIFLGARGAGMIKNAANALVAILARPNSSVNLLVKVCFSMIMWAAMMVVVCVTSLVILYLMSCPVEDAYADGSYE